MKHFRHVLSVGFLFAIAAIFAACGSGTSTGGTGSTGGTTPTATNTPATTPTAAATPSPAATTPATSAFINTTQVTIGGKAVTVLTDSKGRTLYYLTQDSATKVTCSGGCASIWPPALFSGSGTPTSSESDVTPKLTVFKGANGSQIEYNGHPLYTFSGDTGPGQTNGQGYAGVWFAMQETGSAYSNGGY